jgi:hypothetical protein
MANYYKVDVSLGTNSVTVGAPSPQEVIVTLPLVGPAGAAGATGATGANGQGVPVGGTTGQVLRKASGDNYDTEWAAAASGSGSVTSVALAGTGLSISGSPVTTSGTITANVAYGSTAGTAAEGNDARLSDSRTPLSHNHGNLTNAGAIGTTSGLPLKTGTSGVIEAGAFGTSAGQFAEGNHTHAASAITSGVLDNARVNFAAPAAIGNTTPAAANFTSLRVDPKTGSVGSLVVGSTTGSETNIVVLDVDGIKMLAQGGGNVATIARPGVSANRSYTLPDASGTIALTSDTTKNLWVPASAWIPKSTSGCGVDSREIGATNRQNFDELLFDPAADEFAQALVIMPSNYNNGTITARFYWTASAAGDGTDDVVWGISGLAYANDDALDTATGTPQTVTDTLLATNDMHVSNATSAVTVGGTPSGNKPIQFTVYRDADAGADTYGGDARLLGVEIIFN